jgi:hypothetical protein
MPARDNLPRKLLYGGFDMLSPGSHAAVSVRAHIRSLWWLSVLTSGFFGQGGKF